MLQQGMWLAEVHVREMLHISSVAYSAQSTTHTLENDKWYLHENNTYGVARRYRMLRILRHYFHTSFQEVRHNITILMG
jgi:hypothetical protein